MSIDTLVEQIACSYELAPTRKASPEEVAKLIKDYTIQILIKVHDKSVEEFKNGNTGFLTLNNVMSLLEEQ